MTDKEPIQLLLKIEKEITSLKRKNILLSVALTAVITVFLLFSFIKKGTDSFDKIRTKELIVEDANGNDRVIISPHLSTSKTRLRKDTLSGILILDEFGKDRVIVGTSPTVSINGKISRRAINSPYGIAFNDEKGDERGGLGYYADRKLSVLGLDGPSGEGIVLFVPDKELFGQKAGMIINDPQKGGQLIYLGANTKGEKMLNFDTPGKGRLAIEMDSASNSGINYYDYIKGTHKVLLNRKN